VEAIELSRFKKSYCLLVVIRVTVFVNTICPTNDELARYEYAAPFVPSETDSSREALSYP